MRFPAGQLPPDLPSANAMAAAPVAVDVGWLTPVAGLPTAPSPSRRAVTAKPVPRDAAVFPVQLLQAGVGYPTTPPPMNLLVRLQALVSKIARRPNHSTSRVQGYATNPLPLPNAGPLMVQNSAFQPFSGGPRVTLAFSERLTPAAAYAYHETMSTLGLWAKAGAVGVVLPTGKIFNPRPEYRRVMRAPQPSNLPAVFGEP